MGAAHGLAVPPGDAPLRVGPLPAGGQGHVAHPQPQLEPAPQPGLRHGEAPAWGGVQGGAPGRPSSLPAAQVLCCVDKQGVLSGPNPSPETVLFFSGRAEPPHSSHEDLTEGLSTRSFCQPEVAEEVGPGLAPGRDGAGARGALRGLGPRPVFPCVSAAAGAGRPPDRPPERDLPPRPRAGARRPAPRAARAPQNPQPQQAPLRL